MAEQRVRLPGGDVEPKCVPAAGDADVIDQGVGDDLRLGRREERFAAGAERQIEHVVGRTGCGRSSALPGRSARPCRGRRRRTGRRRCEHLLVLGRRQAIERVGHVQGWRRPSFRDRQQLVGVRQDHARAAGVDQPLHLPGVLDRRREQALGRFRRSAAQQVDVGLADGVEPMKRSRPIRRRVNLRSASNRRRPPLRREPIRRSPSPSSGAAAVRSTIAPSGRRRGRPTPAARAMSADRLPVRVAADRRDDEVGRLRRGRSPAAVEPSAAVGRRSRPTRR